MKKISIALIAMVIALVSCQQELTLENAGTGTGSGSGGTGGPTGPYYVKFKLNGVQQDYRYLATGAKGTLGPVQFFSVVGRPASALQPAIGININDASAIVINRTYDDTPVLGTFSSLQYNDAASTSYSTAVAVTPDFQCRFSEITATSAKGTFKGNCSPIASTAVLAITDGEFYVKIF